MLRDYCFPELGALTDATFLPIQNIEAKVVRLLIGPSRGRRRDWKCSLIRRVVDSKIMYEKYSRLVVVLKHVHADPRGPQKAGAAIS